MIASPWVHLLHKVFVAIIANVLSRFQFFVRIRRHYELFIHNFFIFQFFISTESLLWFKIEKFQNNIFLISYFQCLILCANIAVETWILKRQQQVKIMDSNVVYATICFADAKIACIAIAMIRIAMNTFMAFFSAKNAEKTMCILI